MYNVATSAVCFTFRDTGGNIDYVTFTFKLHISWMGRVYRQMCLEYLSYMCTLYMRVFAIHVYTSCFYAPDMGWVVCLIKMRVENDWLDG